MAEVLDHGYVKFIESWGSDERIIEAARMSTLKGFQGWGPFHSNKCKATLEKAKQEGDFNGFGCNCPKGDEKLLAYLYNNKHMTPFEMAGMIIEVQAPIFVFREWHRHRTQSYNELSARYTELPDLYYVPSIERLMNAKQGMKNKQGSEEGFTEEQAKSIQADLCSIYKDIRLEYDALLENKVAREIARLVIPVAQYSRMRASANLRNWLAFLTLRTDQAAQYEIRQYAFEVAKLIQEKFPRTYELYWLSQK